MEKAKMETEKSKETSNAERRPYRCEKCIFSFKSYMELELKFHGQSAHEVNNGLKCNVCETVFKKSCLWQKDHRSNQNSLGCIMHNLNIHMASINEERKLIQCPNIKYQIGGSQNFQQALSMRNKSQLSVKFVRNVLKRGVKKPFKCTFCESIFSQKQHMRGHVEKVHEGKNPFYVLFLKNILPKRVT